MKEPETSHLGILGVYEKAISNHLSWEEKLILAHDSGFDCVEMSIDGTPERMSRLYSPSEAETVRSAICSTGVPIYTLALTLNRKYPLGSEDFEIRSRGIELVKRAVGFAEEIGIRVMHLAGYDDLGEKSCEKTGELFYESVRSIMDYAADSRVQLAIETMDAAFMGSCRRIRALCEEIGSPKLRIYADVGNLAGMGYDLAEELRIGGDYIIGVHLKDSLLGVMRDVSFGEGIVDFCLAFQSLKEIGYQGPMIAEMWSYDQESFHPYLKTASAFLRNKMTEC